LTAIACLAVPFAALAQDGLQKVSDAFRALAQGSAAVPGNLVVNGSFEEPVQPRGRYATVASGQTFSGWRVIGVGSVSPISGEYRQGGILFNAHHGAQWLDLTGPGSNSAAGVEQAVGTQPGAAYELVFWVGNVGGGGFGTSSSVEVYVDGKSAGTATNDKTVAGRQGWGRFRIPVTARGTTTTLAFVSRDPRNDNSNGLDAVSLTPVAGGATPANESAAPAVAAPRGLGGEYVYQGRGVAIVSQIGDEVRMFFTWTPQGQGPHYEARGKLAGDTITGEWYSHYHGKGWFRLVGRVRPNGDIDLSQSDDPINANMRATVLSRKP
jgi:hypothetical protein